MRHNPASNSSTRRQGVLTGLVALFLALAGTIAHAAEAPRQALEGADLERVAIWTAPRIDVDRLLAEDEADRADSRTPERIGTAIVTDLSPANSGTWSRESGHLVWRIALHSEGALWLLPGFDRLRLGPGAELSLHDPAGRTRLGPFTQEDVTDGQLRTPPIDGDTVVVQIDWPDDVPPSGTEAHLGRVYHGYRSWNGSGTGESGCTDGFGECNVGVNCPLGDDWQDEKRGVVRLTIFADDSVGVCSGTLINNTDLDCRPLILTAEHCFTNLANPSLATLTVLFNYERPGCGPGSAFSSQSVTGVRKVAFALNFTTDFRLLEIIDPLPDFELYFNGWSRRIPSPAASHYTIHHPRGAPKKISRTGVALVPSVNFDSHWRVVRWSQGATDGGSSGSPLFDPFGRVIGQLHSGSAECVGSNPGPGGDDFGRFDVAWDGHPVSVLRLKEWLDPGGSDLMTLAGMDQSFCGDLRPKLEHAGHEVTEIQVRQDGDLDPGDTAELQLLLTNVGPLSAGTGAVVGSLSAPGDPEVVVFIDEADWPVVDPGKTESSAEPHFVIDIDPGRLCGKSIRFEIDAESDLSSFLVGTGSPIGFVQPFEDDMESGNGAWSVVDLGDQPNPWARTIDDSAPDDGTTSWVVTDVPGTSDSVLMMPPYSSLGPVEALERYSGLPPGLMLRFEQRMTSECGPDGGVLEYRLDGAEWLDAGPLITQGGYNAVIVPGNGAPFVGRKAWSGDLGDWHTVEVDFSKFEGASDLQLRWRFATDAIPGGTVGWYIDNVVLEAPDLACPEPSRREVPGAYCRGHLGGDIWPPPMCTSRPRDDFGRRR